MTPPSFGVMRAPRHILFGSGQRGALPGHIVRLGQRALFVTDARMARDPVFGELCRATEAVGVHVTVFDGVEAELPLTCIADGTRADPGAEVIVGIGGGSCLDAAKVIALLLTHGGTPADYYGEYRVPGPVRPLIALPTTAGTGSEVTPVAVLGDPDRAMKIGISSPYLIPEVAICDPDLTLTCPPGLTAISGADALTHAIEAFTTLRRDPHARLSLDHVSVGRNAMSDLFAIEAIRLIGASLVRAVEDGSDAQARSDMLRGAMLAGLAFGAAGVGAAHAIQYPVGAMTHTAHGAGVATLMPYVMAWNLPACEAEMAAIGAALGEPVQGPVARQAAGAIDAVARLFARIAIPATLADLGLGEERLDEVADLALSIDRLVKNNPRPLSREDMRRLVGAAFHGQRALLSDTAGPDGPSAPA